MNKMLGYLKDYKRESVLAPLFKMLEATFDLFVPLVMADIVPERKLLWLYKGVFADRVGA